MLRTTTVALCALLVLACQRQGISAYADLPSFDSSDPAPWDVPSYETNAHDDSAAFDFRPSLDIKTTDSAETKTTADIHQAEVTAEIESLFDGHTAELLADTSDTTPPACTCGAPDAPCLMGHTSFTIESDTHPDLPAVVFYPACSSSEDAPVAFGHHPVFIFGHGYQQSVADYQYIWEALVPLGIIVALPDRLTAAAEINIDGFADDFLHITAALAMWNLDSDSIFYRRVSGKIAVGGHSTGGGASLIAASDMRPGFTPTAVVVLAPLGTLDKKPMTGPYPLDAAAVLHSPTLLQEAQFDCILLNELNSQPIWSNIPLNTPAWMAALIDGDHCGFTWIDGPLLWLCEAAEKGLCWDFANDVSTQPPTMGSALQNDLALTLAVPFLSWQLLGDSTAEVQFEQVLEHPEYEWASHSTD